MQRIPDLLQHPVRVRQHVGIPEAQDANPRVGDGLVAFLVVCLLRRIADMLAAVQLDCKPSLVAVEVNNIIVDRVLTSKPSSSPSSFKKLWGA